MQPIWTSGVLDVLYPRLLGGTIDTRPSRLEATGIPPHIVIAKGLQETNKYLQHLEENILQKLSTLPAELKEEMLTHFQVNGAQPITKERLEEMLILMENRLTNIVANSRHNHHVDESCIDGMEDEALQSAVELIEIQGNYEMITWGNRLHCVPESFRIAG